VPYADERQAYEILKQELDADHIDIIGIEDQFIFDPSKIEAASKAPENLTWLSLYEEVKRFNATIFTPMHMFEEDDSTPVEDP